MYEPLLFVHSWFRWIVLLSMIYFFGRSVYGWTRKISWAASDNQFMWAFNQMFAYQVMFGLALWIALSPYSKAGFKDAATLQENPVVSFWTIRHPATMLIAIAIFQIGHLLAKRRPADSKFRIYAVTFGLVLVAICSAIPWPGLDYGRALFRWIF